jgi:hypothetical protein
VYIPVPRSEIAETLIHLRDLFRQIRPSNERERRAHEKREVVTKNLLSNLFRTKDHPTLHTVLEVAEIFSLTLDGAHRLFGYDLDEFRAYDLRFNSGRTHIVESYPFERDLRIDLPANLGPREMFGWNATLGNLVSAWQTDIPIRVLDEEGWHEPGTFYIHVGTADSLGSSLPAGTLGLVESIDEQERQRPNPRSVYLLQFGNGYRCSRCVVSRGKLLLLVGGSKYVGPQSFVYPGGVRVAGRIRACAMRLPLPEYSSLDSLPPNLHKAPLILPWEHRSLDRLFATEHLRFQRPTHDNDTIRKVLETMFRSRLSARTERRYRKPTRSKPHINTLLQLTLMNVACYTDALRACDGLHPDSARFSLQTLLHATSLLDVSVKRQITHLPTPRDLWEERRREFVEWPALLSINFPQLQSLNENVVRLSEGNAIRGLDPPLNAGSLLALEAIKEMPTPERQATKTGWDRPLYALRRGANIFFGHLDSNADQFALLSDKPRVSFGRDEFAQLSRVSGVAVPL